MHYERRNGLSPKPYPTTAKGKIVWLNESERKELVNMHVTLETVDQRLNEGWTVEQAISLNQKYVTYDNEIHYFFKKGNRIEYIPLAEMEKAEIDRGIAQRTIAKRLNQGMTVRDALTLVPITTEYKSIERDVQEQQSKLRQKAIEKQERVKRQKLARKRANKPHLYDGTPQKHTFGKYAQYLTESYTFKCAEVTK